MTGERVLIIGATSAIAQEAARTFAERSASLFLAARDAAKLEIVASDLSARGAARVETAALDLNDLSRHATLVDDAGARLGGAIDVALICHGVLGDQKASEASFEAAELVLRTNFTSAASLLTHLANRMEARRAGTIAVISSVAGDRGRQSNYVYGASKAGLDAFLQGLRNRLSRSGVAVVTIKPGFVDTPMTANLKKGPLFASARAVGRGIVRAIDRKKEIVYLPWFWSWIMAIIRIIPERVFKRMKL